MMVMAGTVMMVAVRVVVIMAMIMIVVVMMQPLTRARAARVLAEHQ